MRVPSHLMYPVRGATVKAKLAQLLQSEWAFCVLRLQSLQGGVRVKVAKAHSPF